MANRTALARATEASEAPTPGYLYVDIAKNASNPVAAVEIAQYLTRRLQKNNHNVKYKCLKVIAKTASAGSGGVQFKRAMSQNPEGVSAVKEALSYRGPPDPARGDEPSERVRAAAKEALDAIYSDTPSSATPSHMGSMSGIGSNSYSSGGGGGHNLVPNAGPPPGAHPHATRRMEGIGNPNFEDPRLAQSNQNVGNMTIGELGAVVGDTIVGMIKDPLAKNVEVQPRHAQHAQNQQRGGYGGPPRQGYSGGGSAGGMSGIPSSSYGPPPGRAQLAQQTNNQWTMASNRGPDAYSGGAGAFCSGGVGGSWGSVATAVPTSSGSIASQTRAPPQPLPNRSGFAPPRGQGGIAVSDGSYEKNMIVELCPPGGMKAEPPPDKLASFRSSVPSLNPDLICPAILDTLEDGNPWIMRAKALCVMEVAIQQAERHDPNNNAYADFFHACAAEIEPLASHPRVAIKEPAKRVLKLLGIDVQAAGAPPVARNPAAAPAPVPAPAADLLGFDDEPAEPVPPPASAPPPPTQPQPPAPAGGSSMFGGMKVKSATPAATAAAPEPAQEESLLGETPAPATALSSSSQFGGVRVKEAATEKKEEPTVAVEEVVVAAAASSGSAFGFMNKDSSVPTASANSTPTAAAPPKASFDPLLSPSATNSTPAMQQMSPAQMQAILMQQQAMNQQAMMMQMQQMQIAYQQNGGPAPPMMPAMMHPGAAAAGKPNVMHVSSHGTQASSSFSFLDAGGKPPEKEDTKFDFIKDAMKKG